MTEQSLTVQSQPIEQLLNIREQEAHEKYLRGGGAPLAPSTAGKFFELFLQGHSCEEIAKLNPGFGLGIVVKARLDHHWDDLRNEHMLELMKGIRSRVQQSHLEAVVFAADAMAVYHKLMGDKFKKFLQTGDPAELGEFKNASFRTYKDFVDMLLKLTGQDGAKKAPPIDPYHNPQAVEQPGPPKAMTADEARMTIRGYVKRVK